MNSLSQYIIEKFKISKDIKIKKSPEEGDVVMVIIYLTGEKDCILKTAFIKSIFRNTIVLDYGERTNASTMFILNDTKKYLGKSEDGDLVFDKDTAIELIDNHKGRCIFKDDEHDTNVLCSDETLEEYYLNIKKFLKEN